MVIRRNPFFLLVTVIYFTVVVSPKLVWVLGTEKTIGIFSFQGYGNALEQFPERSSFIYFIYRNDTVWFKGPGGLGLPEDSPIPVRFHKNNPRDAKIDNFRSIWMPTIVYGTMPFLVVIVIFFHPHIIPWRSRIVLIPRKPFIKVIP